MALRFPAFLLSLALSSFALFGSAAQSGGSGKGIEVVALGEITRLDSAGRWFILKGLLPEEDSADKPQPRQSVTVGDLSVSVSSSVTRGRVTVGGGVGEPDAGPSPFPQPAPSRNPSPDPKPETPATVNMRIWIKDSTRIVDENGTVIPFSALHKGQQAKVRGAPKDDAIDAAEVSLLTPLASPTK